MSSAKASRTPASKRGKHSSQWFDINLSPVTSWTPAPDGVRLSSSEDEITPTSLASSSRSIFSTPRLSKQNHSYFFSSHSKAQGMGSQYGYLGISTTRSTMGRFYKPVLGSLVALLLAFTTSSWSSFEENNWNLATVSPSPQSPSGKAKMAFQKLYPRDWFADPSLWVVLEASSKASKDKELGSEDSRSFIDDTSLTYEQGKQFCSDLTDYLEERFKYKDMASVRVTSYYSLQEEGLDYWARHMVTPDGSTTVVQVQFIQQEIGTEGVKKLKKTIVDFASLNPLSCLNVRFTGQAWNGTSIDSSFCMLPCLAIMVALIGLLLNNITGVHHSLSDWGLLMASGMTFSLSSSAIFLSNIPYNQLTSIPMPTLAALSFILSAFFSKLQVDRSSSNGAAEKTIALSCGTIVSLLLAIFLYSSSPDVSSTSVAATALTLSTLCFHVFLAKGVVSASTANTPKSKYADRHSQEPNKRTVFTLYLTAPFFLLLGLQATRLNGSSLEFTHGAALAEFGQRIGHGQLTQYRLLFDGHNRNKSLTSLNGYVQ